jgi:hypothetical protein
LWIVGTALFVLAIAFVSYSEIKTEFDLLHVVIEPTLAPWETLGWWASIALGIPLVVLALGASLVWAFSGFAARRSVSAVSEVAGQMIRPPPLRPTPPPVVSPAEPPSKIHEPVVSDDDAGALKDFKSPLTGIAGWLIRPLRYWIT